MNEQLAPTGPLRTRVGTWNILFDGVYLRLQRIVGHALEAISLNVFGYGAFSVQKDERTTTYFRDGSSSVTQPSRMVAPLKDEIQSTMGFLELTLESDSLIRVVHQIDKRTWTLDTRSNVLRVSCGSDSLLSLSFTQVGKSQKVETPESKSPEASANTPFEQREKLSDDPDEALDQDAPEEFVDVLDDVTVSRPLPEPEDKEEPAILDDSQVKQEATPGLNSKNSLLLQSGQRIPLNLPITLKSKERRLLKLVAEYGQLTDASLKKATNSGRPVRPRMSSLIDKLNKAGFPLIEENGELADEGFLYTFNLVEAERMGF